MLLPFLERPFALLGRTEYTQEDTVCFVGLHAFTYNFCSKARPSLVTKDRVLPIHGLS